jgi:aldehyde dehydrogenase (NAD+)
VGKIVAKAAAENLCPVTLELGGKNPCIITKDADLKLSAKRITWGKFTNNGQTCIAPDYLLVDNSVKEELIQNIKKSVEEFYGINPQENKDYSRIINHSNFERLRDMSKDTTIIHGGEFDESDRYISPTLIEGPELDHSLMLEEIFGPVLPIYGYDDISEVRGFIEKFEAPLAFYLFTSKARWAEKFMSSFSYGGGSINDVMAHFINSKLPFGGKGHSGLGAYHGKHSIRTFQHESALTTKSTWLDIPLRYPPYSNKEKLMSSIMRLFS